VDAGSVKMDAQQCTFGSWYDYYIDFLRRVHLDAFILSQSNAIYLHSKEFFIFFRYLLTSIWWMPAALNCVYKMHGNAQVNAGTTTQKS
jgi:hypothetical protein